MSKTTKKNRFAWLRQYAAGRELSRSLRESLLVDVVPDGESGWVVRNSLFSGNTTIEYVLDGDANQVRFSLKLMPCTCLRSYQTVQVAANGAVVWLPPLARLLLRNAVRLFLLRYANRLADATLGN